MHNGKYVFNYRGRVINFIDFFDFDLGEFRYKVTNYKDTDYQHIFSDIDLLVKRYKQYIDESLQQPPDEDYILYRDFELRVQGYENEEIVSGSTYNLHHREHPGYLLIEFKGDNLKQIWGQFRDYVDDFYNLRNIGDK